MAAGYYDPSFHPQLSTEDEHRTQMQTASGINVRDAAARDTDVPDCRDPRPLECLHSGNNKWLTQIENMSLIFKEKKIKG